MLLADWFRGNDPANLLPPRYTRFILILRRCSSWDTMRSKAYRNEISLNRAVKVQQVKRNKPCGSGTRDDSFASIASRERVIRSIPSYSFL